MITAIVRRLVTDNQELQGFCANAIFKVSGFLTCTKRLRDQVRENIQPVPSAEKYAAGAIRGKTCNPCQRRENSRVPSYDWLNELWRKMFNFVLTRVF